VQRSNRPLWFEEPEELTALVRDEDSVSISGFHFTRAPIAQVRALCEREARRLTYVAWGGGLPLEMLLAAKSVRKLVFCFSSLDIFGLAPRFRQALELGEVEVEEWTALGMIQGFKAAAQQVPYLTFQAPVGSGLYHGFALQAPGLFESEQVDLAAAPALHVDNFLLHAQRADEEGNVEIQGARGLDVSTLFAAKQVLVTIEEVVPNGALGSKPNSFIVPKTFVTALCAAPFGAYPTSCLPFYPTDYRNIAEIARLDKDSSPLALLSPPPQRRRAELRALASVASSAAGEAICSKPRGHEPTGEDGYTIDELMACALAREIDDGSICSVGSVSPLATVAYLLAKKLYAPGLLLITSNGGYVDVPLRPMSIATSEVMDFGSAAVHFGGDDTYHWFYQKGLVTHEVVSAAQIDQYGRTNNVGIERPDGRKLRLPGQGGMADVADMHQNFSLYLTRHSNRNMVAEVDFVSAARTYHDEDLRRRYGYQPGETSVLTNLGRFRFDPQLERLVLTRIHPGVTVEEVRENTGFPLLIAPELQETEPPTPRELRAIREEIDPLGIRRLEFVPGRERMALIEELLESEEEALAPLLSSAVEDRLDEHIA
jgi:glutaconate CoA-transferase subunit A